MIIDAILKKIEQQNRDRVKRLEKRSELRDCIRQEVSQEISTQMNQKKKALTTHTMRSRLTIFSVSNYIIYHLYFFSFLLPYLYFLV